MKSTLRDDLLEATLTGNSYTSPSNVYLALYSTAPTATAAGTELSGDGYAREAVSFTVSDGVASNSADIEVGPATADWVTVTGWAITDASTSGNQLYVGTFNVTQTIRDGRTLTIRSGDLDIALV